MLQAALDNYAEEEPSPPPSNWALKFGSKSKDVPKTVKTAVVSPEPISNRSSRSKKKPSSRSCKSSVPSLSRTSKSGSFDPLSSLLTTQNLTSSVDRPPLQKSLKCGHPPLQPPQCPPSSSPSFQLSASGVDLRRWIQEVQQRADEDARKTDPFGIADRRWSSPSSSSKSKSESRPLPSVPFDVEKEASKVMSSLPNAEERKKNKKKTKDHPDEKKSNKGSGKGWRREKQKENYPSGGNPPPGAVVVSPPESPASDVDQSLQETRIILDAYSKVEKEAEKVRVTKFGKVGAEEFISKVRRRQQENNISPAGPRREKAESSVPAAAPQPLPPPPVPEAFPEKPKRIISKTKSRKGKIEAMKAVAELARAHETAIKIAHQRSRRRVLKKCFLHFALFIMMEAQRVSNMKSALDTSKSTRVRTNVLRRWRAFALLVKTKLEKFVRVRRLKMCRGVFSTWVAVTKDNRLILDGFYREAEWRMKGRYFSSMVKFARNATAKREEAAMELQRIQVSAKNKKAKRWWRSNVLSRVFVVWTMHAKAERERKQVATCHERRRGRVKDLFERVKNVEVVAEKESGEKRGEEMAAGIDGGDDVESVLSKLLEGGGAKDRRVAALRNLLDKCIQESDRGGQEDMVVEEEEGGERSDGNGNCNGNGNDSCRAHGRSGLAVDGRRHGVVLQLPRNVVRENKCNSDAASTLTRSTAVPKSVASMFSRHEERAKRRAALNARYAILNNEKDKRKMELESKRRFEDAKKESAKRTALVEQKRQEELALLRKKEELERRKEMWKLACMHHMMGLLGGVVMKRWKAKIGELRLKEKKAVIFRSDCVLSRFWKLLVEYVEVRKDLRRNLEARAARKADEYFFDALCWKVFSAWAGHMKTLRAKFRAVRSQNIYRRRIKAFERWRIALDGERLIWWEIEKHAQIKGRVVNLRYLFKALRQGVKEAKHRRKEDEKVAKKMLEVKGWLGR